MAQNNLRQPAKDGTQTRFLAVPVVPGSSGVSWRGHRCCKAQVVLIDGSPLARLYATSPACPRFQTCAVVCARFRPAGTRVHQDHEAFGRHTVRRNAFRDGSTNTRADAEPPSRSHLRSDNHPEPNQRADRNGDQHRDWNPERKAAATISINGSISSYVGARPSPRPAQVGSGRAGCPVALRDIPAPDFRQCRNEPIDLLIRM